LFFGVGSGRLGFARFLDAFPQHADRRLNLTFLPLARDDPEHLEDILQGFEVVAAIAEDMDDADDSPVLQFP
jgi:hypothetical protein